MWGNGKQWLRVQTLATGFQDPNVSTNEKLNDFSKLLNLCVSVFSKMQVIVTDLELFEDSVC